MGKTIKTFWIFCIIFCNYAVFFAQETSKKQQDTPPPQVSSETSDLITGKADFQYQVKLIGRLTVIDKWASILYRNPTKKELDLVTVDPDYLSRYKLFLEKENSGIIRLLPNSECLVTTKELSDDAICNTIPGRGSAYSFRINNYRIERLADLIYTDDSFQASGVLLHGIFVNIGDTPLESVSLETKGLNELLNFKAETDYKKASLIDQSLTQGIQKNGFIYRRGLRAIENTTYILRSIAYKGEYINTINDVSYNELDFDKRFDIVVAFRVIEKVKDGSVILLWKELDRKKSPKIKKS